MLKWINKKRNQKGFTLIELIVVIAILGILAALAIPRLSGTRDNANRSAVVANLRTIDSAISIAEADGKLLVDKDGNAITAPTIDNLKDLGYLSTVPKVNSVELEYSITTPTGTEPYQAQVKLAKDAYGKTNTADAVFTVDGLTGSSGIWK